MMTKKPKMLNAVQKPKLFSTEKRIARNKKAVARKTRKKDLTTSKRMELVNMLKKELGKDGYNQIRKDASKVKLSRSQKSAINKINNYYDYEQSKEKSIAKRKKRITKLSNKPKMAMKKPKLNAGFDKLPKEVQKKQYLDFNFINANISNVDQVASLRFNIYKNEMEFMKNNQVFYLRIHNFFPSSDEFYNFL